MAMLAATPEPTKTLFVICPIGADDSPERKASDELMEYVVDPVAGGRYKVVRADKIMKTGSITSQIFDLLVNAEVVIADMTGHNANVFYELAVRHAIGKPVIHMTADNGEKIPFDVADQRAIYYTLDLPGAKAAITSLKGMLVEIESGAEEPASPISIAVQRNLLAKSTNSSARRDSEIMSMLSDMRSQLNNLVQGRSGGLSEAALPRLTQELGEFAQMTYGTLSDRASRGSLYRLISDYLGLLVALDAARPGVLSQARHPSIVSRLSKVHKSLGLEFEGEAFVHEFLQSEKKEK